MVMPPRGIPRLYAAASLKLMASFPLTKPIKVYSAALCRGLIEASSTARCTPRTTASIPRLYAAASLKHQPPEARRRCAGGIPRLYAAASLKPAG